MLRAKFQVVRVTKESECRVLLLSACKTTEADNKDWSKYTPSGELSMTITNEAAWPLIDAMEPGQCFYLDITKVAEG